MAPAHKAVFVEDDIARFAPEDGAIFRQAIDVLGDISDADLDEFVVAAARGRSHVTRAIGRSSFVGDDLFEAFESQELATSQEAVAGDE